MDMMPRGRLTRNAHRQLSVVVRKPPNSGPKAAEAPTTAPHMPKAIPRALPVKVTASIERVAGEIMVTPDLIDRGISAGDIIKGITPAVGGRGGGRPNMAQGGGTDVTGLDKALDMVVDLVAEKVGGKNRK